MNTDAPNADGYYVVQLSKLSGGKFYIANCGTILDHQFGSFETREAAQATMPDSTRRTHYILSIQNFGCDGYDVVGDYDTRGEAQQIYNDRYADMAIPYEIARLP
jgi:hypothetical protein